MTIPPNFNGRGETGSLEQPSLVWVNGASVIAADRNGRVCYALSDGSLDRGSIIDHRTPHIHLTQKLLEAVKELSDASQRQQLGQFAVMQEDLYVLGADDLRFGDSCGQL